MDILDYIPCGKENAISTFERKVIQDTLVECGVLKNDGWSCMAGFTDTFYIIKKRLRIEVTK